MDGHQIRRVVRQRLQAVQDRMLTTDASLDRRRQVEAGNRRPIVRLVARTNDDLDAVNPGGSLENPNGAAQDGLSLKKGILLGHRAAEAAAAAAGDDQSGTSWHGRLDNIGLRGAHFGRLARVARTRYCSLNYCALHKMPIY